MAQERERVRAAEEVARMRSELVANVSHELRTPLTVMIGFAELMQDRWAHLSEGQRLEYVALIAQAAFRQLRLVDDLLLLSGLDRETLQIDRKAVALLPLMERAADEVRDTYPDQVVACSGPADLVVLTDPDRVLQILVNLMDNAAKYSPAGSPVEVTCRFEAGRAEVRVRDHGPGIEEQNRAILFSRFGRIPGSRIHAGHVGTGLGLYLSRQLAEAMGGDLDLETSNQKGSTFRLRLPATNDPPGA